MLSHFIFKKAYCLNYKQSLAIFTLFFLTNAFCQGVSLKQLGVNHKINDRMPATLKASEEGFIKPVDYKTGFEDLFIEDNGGVLVSVRNNLDKWSKTEEYAKNWNLVSTGLYEIVDTKTKKSYINRNLLKYIDKRLSGEIKNAEEGSALKKVGKVQKALKPNTKVVVSKSINIKFKARVLQGKAFMIVKNPIADYETHVNANGDVNMNLNRELKALSIHSKVDYNVKEGRWVASFDRPITDKINSRISTHQTDKEMAFSGNAEKRLEFFFSHQF